MKYIFYILLIVCIGCSSPNDAYQLYQRALSSYARKDLEGAKTLCVESINTSPLPQAYLLLAKIYFFTNDSNFTRTIEKYISLTDSSQGYILYARWYLQQHNTDKAIECCNKALVHSPYEPAALYLLGTIQLSQKHYDEAIITFHKAFANYYYLQQIHSQLHSIYTDIGLPQRAQVQQDIITALQHFESYTKGESQ